MPEQPKLKRSLSLPLITFYGLGTILGAGIYVLVGKVAGMAGLYAPLAFATAAIIAFFTAFSYAELSARYPLSAGEATYAEEAFSRRWLSAAVGWSVVLTGVVSAGTIVNGFVGYLRIFVQLPDWLAITLLVILLGLLAAWGISESVGTAAIITLVEVLGLIIVLFVAGDSLATLPDHWQELIPPVEGQVWIGILLGAFLAFYAFIGFEDMVNVAEEVKDPGRNLPLAIFLAVGVSTVLYILVALVAVLSLPLGLLTESDAPLATIIEEKSGRSPIIISLISLVAVVNGALVQIIMASRVVYGMGYQGMAPRIFAKVNPRTQTPILATVLVTLIILVLALWLPIVTLAKATSFIILIIFALMNLSLLRLKIRREPHPVGIANYPIFIPGIGFLLCVGLLVLQLIWGFGK
ncbi:MAG TPA: amino acid permease [Thermodesulfobacteriota bacterium]|nr:amino acid permease [Thermodesulfobacteriota bacterium]